MQHPTPGQNDDNRPRRDPLAEIEGRVSDLERANQQMHTAFPSNDLHLPDFDGHRRAHLAIRRAEEVMQGYKIEASKKVVGWAVVFMLGLMASGAASTIKTIFLK